MPDASETRAFLAEEPSTPLATTAAGIPIRAFSIDSNVSAQSDLTIRPTPRPAPSPSPSPPAPDVSPKASTGRTNASPWWLVPIVVLSAFLFAGTIAPRTELLIKLACNNLHPDWDLVTNSTIVQTNTTSASLHLHLARHLSTPLDLVGRAVQHTERSQITTPGTSPMCLNGTDVNQAVATLNTAIATTSGILSVLTTGWWTQASQSFLSDRVGRVRILTIGAISSIMMDAVFIAVVLNAGKVPGGYNWLIFSNMVDGLFGGFATAMALSNAYISDCVSATERSGWFSLWMGFIFAGMALGPSFGSLLNGWTNNNMSIFYLAAAFDLVYTIFVAFILPESLSLEARKSAHEAHKRTKNAPGASWWKETTLKVLGVLAPLAMFLPRVTKRTGGRKHYNWNATFIGIAYSLHSINSGSYSFKYQYALKAFHWSSTDMGNWLSWLGFTRALHLIAILPLILKGIHWFNERRSTSKQALSESDRAKAIDLLVSRTSLGVDISSYTASALVTTSSSFIVTTTLLSFGGGYPPAIQSLALALTEAPKSTTDSAAGDSGSDDTGRLLGAMSVVSTLCAQIIGPSIFGMLFVATVESLPRSIFWLSAALNAAALGSLLLVRLSRERSIEDDAEYVLLNNMED